MGLTQTIPVVIYIITEFRECLVRSFRQLCLACTSGDGVLANLKMKEVKGVMGQLDIQFKGSLMQDASEFFSKFIIELNEELSNVPTNMDVAKRMVDIYQTPSDNLVKINFLHEREEFHVCSNCNAESSARHSDMAIWCETVSHTVNTRTRSTSLQLLLEQNFAKEKRERRCEECGCETAATTIRLVKLPRVIVIYLKRYNYNHQDLARSKKVRSVIDIPETVNLTSLVTETVNLPRAPVSMVARDKVWDDGSRPPELSYQLASVVSHQGEGTRSGHYVADVFRLELLLWQCV